MQFLKLLQLVCVRPSHYIDLLLLINQSYLPIQAHPAEICLCFGPGSIISF